MVAIPDPVHRVLSPVDAESVDQPQPRDPHYGDPEDAVAVAEACEACGCRWVTDPEAVIPEGMVDCAFCGVWRGRLHRNASLSEFADGGRPDTDPEDTIEYLWAGDSPFFDWETLREHAHLLVLVEPSRSFVDAFTALASRCPYERHVYLRRLGDERR